MPMMMMMCLFQRRWDPLAGCAFRHDTVSQLYDVYYSGEQFSRWRPVTGAAGRSRRRRRRRWYLGVDRHGTVRTFSVRSVRHRHDSHDDDDDAEFHVPRRVLFFQRWIGARPQPQFSFPAGRVSVLPPGWTTPSPAPAAVSPDMDRLRRLRRRRRWPKCSRLLTECRLRRRHRRRPNSPSRTSTTDAALVLPDS